MSNTKEIIFTSSEHDNFLKSFFVVAKDVKVGDVKYPQLTLGHIQQAVGHCCGATFLHKISGHGFWKDVANVEAFLNIFRKNVSSWDRAFPDGLRPTDANGSVLCSWHIRNFYIYLSDETAGFDEGIRKHPKAKLVHEFMNYASRSTGSRVSLYFLEI